MMNKVLAFLEKHVQWIALGLGLLYLGYMVWLYVVQTPVVAVGIAPTPLNPGEVDPFILDNVTRPLETKMGDTSVPDMNVPNFIDEFKADMSFTNLPKYAFDAPINSQVIPIQLTPTQKLNPDIQTAINSMPTLPPATVIGFSTGKSNVQVAPPAPAGNNAAQPVASAADKSWVTVGFTIPAAALAKSFKDVHIPQWTEHTSMLEVELWRQEELPGGKWSDPKLIVPIVSVQPLPPGGAAQQQTFLTWAVAHLTDILQPAFYQVNKGDAWRAPGAQAAIAVKAAQKPLDPTQDYPPDVLSGYPADQRAAWVRARIKAGQRFGAPPPAPAAPGSMNPAVNVGSDIYADVVPPPAPDAVPPAADGAAGAAAGANPPDQAPQYPLPSNGDFDPNTLTADITGWAHDDTAVAAHTYRYMVVYQIKNPIFLTNAAKNKPQLNNIFNIKSPDGPWSASINVASTTNFFVFANSRPGGTNTVRFKVYKWENGVEKSKVFEVSPGDIIGGKDGVSDFNTGWTMVDLRFDDPRNPDSMTVLVMDPNGVLDRRDYRTDQSKPELKALDSQVSSATATGAEQIAGGTR